MMQILKSHKGNKRDSTGGGYKIINSYTDLEGSIAKDYRL
jgi:hypothetical protein